MTEDQLWKSVVNGREDSFRELFNLFYPVLCIYAKRYVSFENANEDIVQNVFVSMWENRSEIDIHSSVRQYLIGAVRNRCLDYLKRNSSHKKYLEYVAEEMDDTSDENIFLLNELQTLLCHTLSKLPEPYRKVFIMRRYEGRSYAEIAEILGISVRTAKRYSSSSKEFLQKELKDYLPILLLILRL